MLSWMCLPFVIASASAETSCDGFTADGQFLAQPTQDYLLGSSACQGFTPQQFNGSLQIYDNTKDQRGNLINVVDGRGIKSSYALDFGEQMAGIMSTRQACDGSKSREMGESDVILDCANSFDEGTGYNFGASGGNHNFNSSNGLNGNNGFDGYGGYNGNNSYSGNGGYNGNNSYSGNGGYNGNNLYNGNGGNNGPNYQEPGKMVTPNRKPGNESAPCIASETIIKVTTSFIEKPPVTITPPPRIITFTKMEEPVTKTLPPLVFKVPTTVFKQLKPMSVTATLPPQIIKQPPLIKTVKQKIFLPPSTVVVSKTFPPIIQTVKVPGPVRIIPSKPSTVYKHITQKIPSPLVTSVKTEYRFVTPNGVITADGSSPGRSSPGLGNNRSFAPNRNSKQHEGRGGSGGYNGNDGNAYGNEGGNKSQGLFYGTNYGGGNSGFGNYNSFGFSKDNLSGNCLYTGEKLGTGSAQNPSFYYLNGSQGNSSFASVGSAQPDIQCSSENNSLGGLVSLISSVFNPNNSGDECSDSNFKSCFLGDQSDGDVSSVNYLGNSQNEAMNLVDSNGNTKDCSKPLSCDGSNHNVLFMND